MHHYSMEGQKEVTVEDIIAKMLKKYDVVEVKKVNGKWQFIGINRKMECQVSAQ